MHCFKIFYTLKLSTRIKINFILLQHVSVPLDHHQGARHSYPKVTTDHLLVRHTVVLRAVPSLTGQDTHRQWNTDITSIVLDIQIIKRTFCTNVLF